MTDEPMVSVERWRNGVYYQDEIRLTDWLTERHADQGWLAVRLAELLVKKGLVTTQEVIALVPNPGVVRPLNQPGG